MSSPTNKRKIMNDPVYGFINIPSGVIFDIIEHPWFQRLRRIKQLALTYLVYPGAEHTRFQHAMGAAHLMSLAIEVIRSKGHEITEEEENAATIAILLHDMGHGPFSHVLEHSIVDDLSHEDLSIHFMNSLNQQFDGQLALAIRIFKNQYSKRFLHQLVSSQLDMDRLDYLRRDSFFSGVSEGVVGSDRIIKMLDVVNDKLVVEAKGIYSIEKFLIARRLMYWQVYLHKTVLAAEQMLIKILQRAKELAKKRIELPASPALRYFLYNKIDSRFLNENTCAVLENFSLLDDFDIIASIKVWASHPDKVLSLLCKSLINRNLYKIELQKQPFDKKKIYGLKEDAKKRFGLKEKQVNYFVFSDVIKNMAYSPNDEKINILYNNGDLVDIADASDMLNLSVLSKTVKKYYLCYPKPGKQE